MRHRREGKVTLQRKTRRRIYHGVTSGSCGYGEDGYGCTDNGRLTDTGKRTTFTCYYCKRLCCWCYGTDETHRASCCQCWARRQEKRVPRG
jgi:hypothetical protein